MLNELFCVEQYFSPVFAGCLEFTRSLRQAGFFFIIATNVFKQVDNTKFKKSVGMTIDKFRLDNGTILRFAYRKIDVEELTFQNIGIFAAATTK